MYVEMYPDKVKELREEKGLSRWELATKAGISLSTAKRVERGGRVTARTARRVIQALGEEPSLEWGRVVGRS